MRYVGKAQNTASRLIQHIKEAQRNKDHSYCGHWKRSLLKEGLLPVLVVIEAGSGPGWSEAEKKWIAHFRSVVGYRLTNYTDGGEGFQGSHSPETKHKMSLAKLGKPKTPEHAANIAAGRKGWIPSEETRQRMREGQRGRTHPPAVRSKIASSLKKTLEGNKYQRVVRSKAAKKYAGRTDEREIRRERLLAIWSDPELRAARVKAMRIAAKIRFHPTSTD